MPWPGASEGLVCFFGGGAVVLITSKIIFSLSSFPSLMEEAKEQGRNMGVGVKCILPYTLNPPAHMVI